MQPTKKHGVIAYCIAESLDWSRIKQQNKPLIQFELQDSVECNDDFVLHRFTENGQSSAVVIFPYGCVVYWNCGPKTIDLYLAHLKKGAHKWYPNREYEAFYQRPAEDSKVEGNTVSLCPDDKEALVAISYALGQAVKLSKYEQSVEETMRELESIPEALSKYGKIPVSRREALSKTGKIFLVRSQINLHSDLLDTPDYFWDRAKSEKIYHAVLKEMDLNKRLGNLNKRLDIMQDLYALLMGHIEHTHTIALELIIVALISVEVLFGVLNWMSGSVILT